jgi:hypothetical protein
MSKNYRSRLKKITLIVMVTVFIVIALALIYFHLVDKFTFNENNAISIFGSIIQGMSALLSVAIAVIVFRIQSLENRNFSLEQSTLNYIFQITHFIYPQWLTSLEDDIRSGKITNRYYDNRVKLSMKGELPWTQEELEKDRDEQQKRLEETLKIHVRNEKIIKQIRERIVSSVIMLISPIVLSLYMLMVSDSCNSLANFTVISIVIVMSAIGTVWLVNLVMGSIEIG